MKVSLLISAGACLLASRAAAQPTAFTYQGRLTSGGQPAAGLHDLRFRLFDAAAGGSQIGTTQCLDNVAVSGGLFTVAIDFGQQFASPSGRFLEIDVRADTGQNCSITAGFITLPRQPVSAAPLATHARSAFALAASDGSPATAVSVDSTGNVGIGTLAPVEPLHIAFPAPILNLQDSDSGVNQVGLVSFRNSTGLETGWLGFGSSANAHAHFMNHRLGGNLGLGTEGLERLTILASGNIGIGTTAPLSRLDVRGDIRLGAGGQLRATGGEENLRIVRGIVAHDGVILAGSGFTVAHGSVANYVVTFDTPFLGPPSVTATAHRPSNDSYAASVMTDGITSTSVTLVVTREQMINYGPVPGSTTPSIWEDTPFSFIAIGRR